MLALVPLLLSCAGPGDELAAIRVVSADLDGIVLKSAAVVGGGVGGRATLNVWDAQGRVHSFPVLIKGSTVGAVVEVDRAMDLGRYSAMRLPDEPLTGDQLLGRYRGPSVGVVVGAGVTTWDLENRHGVELDKEFLTLGVAVFAGVEWVHLSLGGPGGQVEDLGSSEFPPYDSGLDTADTADTAPDSGEDTGPLTWDSSVPPPPPGAPIGCAVRSDQQPQTSDDPEPGDTGFSDAGGSSTDCGGGCQSDSDGACDSSCDGSSAWLMGLLVMVGWRRRRAD